MTGMTHGGLDNIKYYSITFIKFSDAYLKLLL